MTASLPWFRLYAEFATDPVVQSLAFEDQRHFVMVLCLKCKGTLDRDVTPEVRDRIILSALGLHGAAAEEAKRRLIEVRLVDAAWNPRGWEKRQFLSDLDSTASERQRRHRMQIKQMQDVTDESRVTHGPVTRPDTVTDPERSKESALRAEVGAARADPPSTPADVVTKPIGTGRSNSIGNGDSTAAATTEPDEWATDAARAARCPVQRIVALYHETLPMCPRIEKLTRVREGYIRARWREDLPSLDAFRNYFLDVSKSPFLTGHASGSRDRPPFVADLEWLTRPANFAKVAEGRYHRG